MVQKGSECQDQGVLNPRDFKQVSNVNTRIDMQRKLSHDYVYNLVELGYLILFLIYCVWLLLKVPLKSLENFYSLNQPNQLHYFMTQHST